MKKKLLAILTTILLVCSACTLLFGCGDNSAGGATDGGGGTSQTPPPAQAELKEITGISFSSKEYVFDANEKVLLVEGSIPTGVSVSYKDNKGTNAGTYNATATLSGEGYKPLTLSATLIINKADITNLSVEETQTVIEDGKTHLPKIVGNLPSGVTVKYYVGENESTGVSSVGTHVFRIVISGQNYNTLTFDCSLKIKLDLSNLASNVFAAFGKTPDPWSFLPECFSPENKSLNQTPDYTNFYSVSNIPKNGIGKQLNVAYGLLNKTSTALTFVRPIYTAFNAMQAVYTTFLSSSPDDYTYYENEVAGINFKIYITDTQYVLSASVKSVQVVIFSDLATKTYGAKIQLTETSILKYTVSENSLLVAMDILDHSATQLEFVRNNKEVLGYMYEFIHANDKTLVSTSTLIDINEDYTTLIGTKGDFIPTAVSRNCEVYSSKTGNLVGTEVREELTIGGQTATYNTLWYTLDDVLGIDSIKKVDKQNFSNPDTIYINNANDSIHSKNVGGFPSKNNPKALSRRFDIEFKTMYFYTYNQEKQEYETTSCEIPMLFVQEEYVDSFAVDFVAENSDYLNSSVAILTSSQDKTAVNYGYYTLLTAYDLIKELVTFDKIVAYCKA